MKKRVSTSFFCQKNHRREKKDCVAPDGLSNTIVTSVEDCHVAGELTAKFWNRCFWRELIREMERAPEHRGAKDMSMIWETMFC